MIGLNINYLINSVSFLCFYIINFSNFSKNKETKNALKLI